MGASLETPYRVIKSVTISKGMRIITTSGNVDFCGVWLEGDEAKITYIETPSANGERTFIVDYFTDNECVDDGMYVGTFVHEDSAFHVFVKEGEE